MGGGAGINFTFRVYGAEATLDLYNQSGRWRGLWPLPCGVKRARRRKNYLTNVVPPEIESFDMEGYEAGFRNARGDLLKAEKLVADPLDRDDVEYILGCGCKTGDVLSLSPSRDRAPRTMLFSGFIRGDIHKEFPLDVPCEMTLDVGYGIDLNCMLVIGATEEFYQLYDAVFHSYEYVTWDEDGEEAVEDYWADLRTIYRAR